MSQGEMTNIDTIGPNHSTTSAQGRIRWTEKMKSDLLECKSKAKQATLMANPPRKANGRKKGYMLIMKELWDELGYSDTNLTSSQNLRDQAANLEKTLGNVGETIRGNIGTHIGDVDDENSENNVELNIGESPTMTGRTESNLHNTSSISTPEGVINMPMNAETEGIINKAYPILEKIDQTQGDLTKRDVDTRTKKRPNHTDIANINLAINELMKQKCVDRLAHDRPLVFLWKINCILYAVVVAFLLYKGWKKEPGSQTYLGRQKTSITSREEFIKSANEIRKKLSIAKAELERITENRKITKKGRKNRASLETECGKISTRNLVNFLEKKKSTLRKLKKTYWRKKKQEEAREINKRFQQDPGKVFASMKKIITKDDSVKKPTYEATQKENEETQGVFENIEEASSFWKELWESQGTGNINSEWLEEVRQAIHDRVPPPSQERFEPDTNKVAGVILKKRNWSAPGPDKIANYWWKKANSLHGDIAKSFREATHEDQEFPMWFTEGKTSLNPKPGEFSSDNQRPITCLNTLYKWFSACLLKPIDLHLEKFELMQGEQRGAREKCSGTIDNLLIDRMVCQDSIRSRRNLSMAWIDVKKAYDTIDHEWLNEMMSLHRFPVWIAEVVRKLSRRWNTRIKVRTKQGIETSEVIMFNKGLPQGDALCPRLFTLCMNPVAWMLKATEGYRMSKPINTKITDLLYIDDLKIFAASGDKLQRVLKWTKTKMEDTGLQWNKRKCAAVHVKKGSLETSQAEMNLGETDAITCLTEGSQYKFLGVMENSKQEDGMVLKSAAKSYLQRLSVIWSSPLSDFHKVMASNQFALPVLSYLMWTQTWPLAELQSLDRETRKVIVENGGKHPLGSTALMYLQRKNGGRGLKSMEEEYKLTKIKAAVKLFANTDPTMETVRKFEKKAVQKGSKSIIKDAQKYAEELGLKLNLEYPNPTCSKEDGTEIQGKKIGEIARKAQIRKKTDELRDEKWQGKLFKKRWDDEDLNNESFAWMARWRSAPTQTIAGVHELYQQLLPTKVYHQKKTRTNLNEDDRCRLCHKTAESVPHILAGCSMLAQSKYLLRHNAALKILFFQMLKDRGLVSTVPPWYSPVQPKPLYESDRAKALWDVPLYAESTEVNANRIDARIVDFEEKKVYAIEMSCPWIENRKKKQEEKTLKYGPLRWELKRQYPSFQVTQHNIIIDVLGGYSKDVNLTVKKLVGSKSEETLRRMQKSIICNSLNIARSFKAHTE